MLLQRQVLDGIHGRFFNGKKFPTHQRKGCVCFFRVNGFCTLQNLEKQPSFFFRSEAKDDAVVPDEGADGEGAWQVCCFLKLVDSGKLFCT